MSSNYGDKPRVEYVKYPEGKYKHQSTSDLTIKTGTETPKQLSEILIKAATGTTMSKFGMLELTKGDPLATIMLLSGTHISKDYREAVVEGVHNNFNALHAPTGGPSDETTARSEQTIFR